MVSDVDEADIVPPVKKAKVTEEDEVGSKEKAEVMVFSSQVSALMGLPI